MLLAIGHPALHDGRGNIRHRLDVQRLKDRVLDFCVCLDVDGGAVARKVKRPRGMRAPAAPHRRRSNARRRIRGRGRTARLDSDPGRKRAYPAFVAANLLFAAAEMAGHASSCSFVYVVGLGQVRRAIQRPSE